MSGGSHVNFDTGAFGLGAAGGALTLAGALVAGAQNVAMAAEADFMAWSLDEARKGLHLSEQLRARDRATLLQAVAELNASRGRNGRLERDLAVMRARQLPR